MGMARKNRTRTNRTRYGGGTRNLKPGRGNKGMRVVSSAKGKWSGRTLEKGKLKPVEKAVLKTLPSCPSGITFDDLVDRIARQLNPMIFPLRKTVSRYTKVVQLDLEKRGVIERIPGVTPLTLRMHTKSRSPSG